MTHTKGPWTVFDDEIVARLPHDNVTVAIVRPVGVLPYDYRNDTQPMHNESANARLIAAAPDLLEALELARSKVGAVWVVQPAGSATEKILDDALAIINKAIQEARES